MKKLIKVVLMSMSLVFCISSLLVCGCFGSCKNDDKMGRYDDPWDYRQEEAGFYYYINTYDYEQDSAIILERTDLTKELDELVIPATLGGCPVVQIGELWRHDNYYGIYAENVKRIIINSKLRLNDFGILKFKGDLIINDEVIFFNTFYKPVTNTIVNANSIQINYYRESHEQTMHVKYTCDVFFEAGDCEQTTYSVIIPINTKLIKLEPPKKEGYDFAGWYKEEALENIWDYEKDIVTETMTLYAKWIETN